LKFKKFVLTFCDGNDCVSFNILNTFKQAWNYIFLWNVLSRKLVVKIWGPPTRLLKQIIPFQELLRKVTTILMHGPLVYHSSSSSALVQYSAINNNFYKYIFSIVSSCSRVSYIKKHVGKGTENCILIGI